LRLQVNREIMVASSADAVLTLSQQRQAVAAEGDAGATLGMVSAATVLNRIARLGGGREVLRDRRCRALLEEVDSTLTLA